MFAYLRKRRELKKLITQMKKDNARRIQHLEEYLEDRYYTNWSEAGAAANKRQTRKTLQELYQLQNNLNFLSKGKLK